jgi:TRAP-type C4-dicarboxylate transport system permease small subunit
MAGSSGSGWFDDLVRWIELAAACFLAAVAALIFVSVFLRYLFAFGIPDAYDIGSLLLGVIIFWGIAGASWRGEHITVDLLWGALPAPAQRVMGLFSELVTLACLGVFAWMMATKVASSFNDNVRTFDLRLPVWAFHLLAWLGLAAACLLLAVRVARMLRGAAPVLSPAERPLE